MVTKYTKGTILEREIKLWLEHNGFYVMRSAGSRGIGDLIFFPLAKEKVDDFPLMRYPGIVQIRSLADDIFNTSTRLDHYLWSRELTDFRITQVLFANKYLIIFNSKSRKDIPYVFEFKNGNYIRIYINGFI